MRTAARLGVGPEAFWRLSLREWRWLTAAPEGERPMGRSVLKRLTEAWPDERDVRAG
ncbi:MAG: phage tail assembly chaperone [Brevundimonas sp.]